MMKRSSRTTIIEHKIGREEGNYKKCSLIVLDCIKDKSYISYLKGIATAQKKNFTHIYPWENNCIKGDKLYVAIDHDENKTVTQSLRPPEIPNICGWARVNFSKAPTNAGGQKLAYIIEISSSQSGKYKGIGSAIIDKISEENIDFIKLTALQSAVGFYEKIGFYTDPDSRKMFKIIKNKPSNKYINWLIETTKRYLDKKLKEKNNEIFEEILDQLDDKEKEKLKKYIDKDSIHIEIVLAEYENSGNDIQTIKDLIS